MNYLMAGSIAGSAVSDHDGRCGGGLGDGPLEDGGSRKGLARRGRGYTGGRKSSRRLAPTLVRCSRPKVGEGSDPVSMDLPGGTTKSRGYRPPASAGACFAGMTGWLSPAGQSFQRLVLSIKLQELVWMSSPCRLLARTARRYATAATAEASPYTPRAPGTGASLLVMPNTVSAPPRYNIPSGAISPAIASSTLALVGWSK